ncbi:scabin-related ADP-ribosyltransferase [Curtobacterium citreum]
MARPTGWDVVDQGDDPVKGDPATIRMMSREYQRISDAASDASTRLNSVKGSGWLTDWEGAAADVFVDAIQDTPSDLSKLVDSYALAASALSGWADVVDDTQYRADGALADAKDAAGDLTAAQSRLSDAQSTLSHYQTAARSLSQVADQYPAGSEVPDGVEVPTPAQVRAASDNTAVAQGSVSSAQGDIAAAQSRIDAAKRLVADARGDWEDGERRTATKIGEAADAGLGKQSFWDQVFGSEAWETIVSVAKVVVAVGGIIAMIIPGPWTLVIAAIALVVLADTLYKMSQGTADGWDLAFALIDCVPAAGALGRLASVGKYARGMGGIARGMAGMARAGERVLASGRVVVARATDAVARGRRSYIAIRDAVRLRVRGGTRPLWRSDNRDPSEIFEHGFTPHRPDGDVDLWEYAARNPPSQYVSTTTDPSLFKQWPTDYRYTIADPGHGVDVNATLGARSPFPHEQEIAFPGGVQPQYVTGAHPVLPGGQLGEWIPNPSRLAQFIGKGAS